MALLRRSPSPLPEMAVREDTEGTSTTACTASLDILRSARRCPRPRQVTASGAKQENLQLAPLWWGCRDGHATRGRTCVFSHLVAGSVRHTNRHHWSNSTSAARTASRQLPKYRCAASTNDRCSRRTSTHLSDWSSRRRWRRQASTRCASHLADVWRHAAGPIPAAMSALSLLVT